MYNDSFRLILDNDSSILLLENTTFLVANVDLSLVSFGFTKMNLQPARLLRL